jgi:hypothetical protein
MKLDIFEQADVHRMSEAEWADAADDMDLALELTRKLTNNLYAVQQNGTTRSPVLSLNSAQWTDGYPNLNVFIEERAQRGVVPKHFVVTCNHPGSDNRRVYTRLLRFTDASKLFFDLLKERLSYEAR